MHQSLLIPALDDVCKYQNSDDEVERRLAHSGDLAAKKCQMRQVTSLRKQHDPHYEEDEESEDLVKSIALQEGGDVAREPDH